MMTQTKRVAVICGLVALNIVQPAHATLIQYFWGTNYYNPALANNVTQYELVLGDIINYTHISFYGRGPNNELGKAYSDQTNSLPYFRGEYRINPCIVVGLNISRPYYTDIQYPVNSNIRYDGTQAIFWNVDFDPHISVKLSDKFFVGAGVNLNYFSDIQINAVVPGVGNLVNQSRAWSFGWNMGAAYTIDSKNSINAAYFSPLNPTPKGASWVGEYYNGDHEITGLNLPDVYKLDYIHMFNPAWTGQLTAHYIRWSRTKELVFNNVALVQTLNFPVHYSDTWEFEAKTRFQANDKFALLGGIIYDQGAANQREITVLFPTQDAYAVALGGDITVSKQASIQLIGAYAWLNTPIIHPLGSATVGNLEFRGLTLDARFTYKI